MTTRQEAATSQTLRPNKRAFVVRPTLQLGAFAGLIALGIVAAAPLVEWSSGLIPLTILGWVLIVAAQAGERTIRFNKTRYRVFDDKIVVETGSLFSESSIDLKFANVTRVSLTVPYLEHKFYKTGHVAIEAAGSAGTEAALASVDSPREVYALIEKRLSQNGFSVRRASVVQQERPGVVASIYELTVPVTTTGFAFIFFLPTILDIWAEIGSSTGDGAGVHSASELFSGFAIVSLLAGLLMVAVIGVGSAVWVVLRFLDLMERTYTIHDDVVDYDDGFLTERKSFIPIENLSDVEVSQSLVQRILGLSTIAVSSQGSGTQINFAAVPNGELFKGNLEGLIDRQGDERRRAMEPRRGDGRPDLGAPSGVPEGPVGPRVGSGEPSTEPWIPKASEDFTPVEARMSFIRAGVARASVFVLVGIIAVFASTVGGAVFDVPEVGFFGLGIAGLMAVFFVLDAFKVGRAVYATRYRVDANKAAHVHELISKKTTEFSYDKVTSFKVRQSPIDRMFSTATVTFTSIGSTVPLKFEHVIDAQTLIDTVVERLGFDVASHEHTLRAEFSFSDMFRAIDSVLLLGTVGLIASLIILSFQVPYAFLGPPLVLVGVAAQLGYMKAFYDRAELSWTDRWVRLRAGVLIKEETFSPRVHVRGIQVTRYIGVDRGAVSIRVSGGVQLALSYVAEPWRQQERLDRELWTDDGAGAWQTETLLEVQPVPVAVVAQTSLAMLVTLVGIVLLPVFLPLAVVTARKTFFSLEGSRVVMRRGIFLKTRQTVLLSRVDHLTTNRGFVHRLTGTGSVGVSTLGSQGTDLSVGPIPDHQAFFERMESLVSGKQGG